MQDASLRKRVGNALLWAASGLIGTKLAVRKLRRKTYPLFRRHYGDFHFDEEWRGTTARIVGNESGIVFGRVVSMLSEVSVARVLLAGESAAAKPVYGDILGTGEITTAGLHDDADVAWNFEQETPELGRFDCIVSHAIIEHLIDPYGHVRALIGLLEPGGYLVIYTVLPGFPYHRHPVDCLRFFPDWFEEVAKRHDLTVRDKYIGDEHIVYLFQS